MTLEPLKKKVKELSQLDFIETLNVCFDDEQVIGYGLFAFKEFITYNVHGIEKVNYMIEVNEYGWMRYHDHVSFTSFEKIFEEMSDDLKVKVIYHLDKFQ